MTEWQHFKEGTIPFYVTPEFFADLEWIPGDVQEGYQERMAMTARVIQEYVSVLDVKSISELGCGDGTLLSMIDELPIKMWGYDGCSASVSRALANELDVRFQDVTAQEDVEYGNMVVGSEMIEHLLDPHGFVRSLPVTKAVFTTPSRETDEWHYEHHAWSWDLVGFKKLFEDEGWTVVHQEECEAGINWHNGITKIQGFQVVVVTR